MCIFTDHFSLLVLSSGPALNTATVKQLKVAAVNNQSMYYLFSSYLLFFYLQNVLARQTFG